MQPITHGEFDVIQEVGMDRKKGVVYFIASPYNFTQRYLYQAKLTGKGEAKRLSPIAQSGQHRYSLSPNGRWAMHTFSNAQTPPVIERISLPDHKRVKLITDNAQARREFEALGLQPKEFVKVRSGELLLDAFMIKPVHFDPSKKYPVIIDVYGEPASSTVQDVWTGGSAWHQYLANLGYIVVSIDNRGANTPRGREWRKCIYGEVGTFACQDQAQGIQDLARQYSFIDLSRVGITGWSGGGSQTLNCMFRYPDVFHTGIAVAFVSDQRLYDTIYQERYMNTPQANPDGYRKGSPITYVEGLKGNLLLIHGTGDDNVHYQSCEMLVNELVRHSKIFSQISYPMRTHSINERAGTPLHLRNSKAHISQIGLQQLATAVLAEAADGLLLDLADTLACETKLVADLLQRHLLLADAEEHLDNLLLAVGQGREGAVYLTSQRLIDQRAVGHRRVVVDQHVEQAVVLTLDERCVYGYVATRNLQRI